MNADGNVTDAAMTSETQVAWGSEQPAQKSSDSWGGGGAAWGAGDSAAEPESTSSFDNNKRGKGCFKCHEEGHMS